MRKYLRNVLMLAFLFMPVSVYSASAGSPAQASPPVAESAPPAAIGPTMPAPEVQEAGQNEGMQFPVLRTIGGMGIVVFLMLAAFYAARRYAPRYFNKQGSAKNLRIIETLSMGDRRSISLVEVGNSRFLVGNTAHQISLLASLPDAVSLVSEPDASISAGPKPVLKKEGKAPFKNLFEVEKNRPVQYTANPLPEDLRTKMRQLREALERS